MNRMRRHRLIPVLRGGMAFIALAISGAAFAASAAADATDDYPIPHRMIITTCTAEQILAAAKDFAPIYYQRYIIDKHNRPPEVQQATIDNAHYFDVSSRTAMMTTTPQLSTDFTGEGGTCQSHQRKGTFIHLMQCAQLMDNGESHAE